MNNNTPLSIFSNTTYDVVKKLVLIIIPGLSTLYFGLSAFWDLPATEKVIGTLTVIAFILGICLTISSRQYEASGAAYDGQIVVTMPEGGPKLFSLELDGDPEELDQKDSVIFKINPQDALFEN